ncbi:MAG: acyltransferase [Bacteroidales bacterium]|nr:acyltransferase [Bacteroidales bacterium]
MAITSSVRTPNKPVNKRVLLRELLLSVLTFRLPIYLLKLSSYYVVNHLISKSKAQIGIDCNIHPTVLIREPQNIIIGSGCYFNHNTIITGGHDKAKVIIGNKVQTGPNVGFYAANHNYENPSIPIKEQGYYEADIIVEDDVWIGANSIITSGVKIGKGSVIGAGSVVTKDIPPYSVAVGSPAKVVKKRE